MDTDPKPLDAMLKLRLIAGAVLLGLVVFAVMAWVAAPTLSGGAGGDGVLQPPIPGVLVLVAALFLVAAPLLEAKLRAASPAPSVDDGSAGERYVTAKVVGYGLREAAGLSGGILVLFGETTYGLAVVAAALVTMLIAWPRAGDLTSRPADLDRPPDQPVEPR